MIPTLFLYMVGECRELEEHFGTNYTDAILEGGDEEACMR